MAADNEKIYDIRERAFQFAVRIVKLCHYLGTKTEVNRILINQLFAAGTSIGANLEEAGSGETGRDFIHKNSISLKEARETTYWLRLLRTSYKLPPKIVKGIAELTQEADELSRIVGKIIVNKKNNLRR
jgi:four helix bundle protein